MVTTVCVYSLSSECKICVRITLNCTCIGPVCSSLNLIFIPKYPKIRENKNLRIAKLAQKQKLVDGEKNGYTVSRYDYCQLFVSCKLWLFLFQVRILFSCQ